MKLLKQIAELFKQLKVVAGVITSVGIIAGATLWVNSTSNSNQSKQDDNFNRVFDSIAVVKQDVYYNSVELSDLNESVRNIQDTLDDFEEEHKAQGEVIESLGWAIKNIDNFTPEQMEEILNRELKKNFVMERWDLEWPDWMTVQVEPDIIMSQN